MVCQFLLYNTVDQLCIYIYPHISSLLHLLPTLPIPPLQVVTKHRADLPVLCGCFPLAISFTSGSVYIMTTFQIDHTQDPLAESGFLGIIRIRTVIEVAFQVLCDSSFLLNMFQKFLSPPPIHGQYGIKRCLLSG